MLKRERQDFILHHVNLHNKMLCTDLSRLMQVSDDTIRRDLQELAENGKLIKVHGGALSTSFNRGHKATDDIYSYTQKKLIAQKAVSLIKDGMFVLTGGGTTIIEMARALPHDLHATFISGSIPVISEYMNHPNIEVIVIGDKVSKNSKITAGPEAVAKIREMRVDLCVLGINAINLQNGVSDNDWEIVQLKKAMIESSQKLICLTIAEKLNTQQPLQVCDCRRINTLITELDASDPLLLPYAQLGIHIR